MIWLLLIPYTTIAFGIHGGEMITGVNRQVRNLICAIPFGFVSWYCLDWHFGLLMLITSFIGTNMGFDNHRLWVKGLVTFPPLGALLLPLAYRVFKFPAYQEYFSGFLYGVALLALTVMRP